MQKKFWQKTIVIFLSLILVFIPGVSSLEIASASGDGTEENPIQIATPEELNEIRDDDPGKFYVLTSDIDLSGDPWNDGEGWEPIGTSSDPFTGNLDGQGHIISGLTINRPSTNYIGLFGSTTESNVSNLTLYVEEIEGRHHVAGLIGHADSTTLNNVHVVGDILSDGNTGLLAGTSTEETIITDSSASGSIEVDSDDEYAGGLIGYADQTEIFDSTAAVDIDAFEYVGGLIGYLEEGSVQHSFALGKIESDDHYAGGLIGKVVDSNITSSYAEGDVTGRNYTGGLVGEVIESEITDSFAKGDVSGRDETGGLVGLAEDSDITNSYAHGNVSGREQVGGLVGDAEDMNIINSHSTGHIEGDDEEIGGLVGSGNNIEIRGSYSTGEIKGEERVGGLIGYSRNTLIIDSYAVGNVDAIKRGGGLAGYLLNDSNIKTSFASGDVSVQQDKAGGLVGYLRESTVYDSYATGDISAEDETGGLIGNLYSSEVENTYATGLVTGENQNIGGLIGAKEDSDISSSYWNETVNSDSPFDNDYGSGKTEGELQEKDTFENWDFDDIWAIHEGNDYPKLQALASNDLTSITVNTFFINHNKEVAVPGDTVSLMVDANYLFGDTQNVTELTTFQENDEDIISFIEISNLYGDVYMADFQVNGLGNAEITVAFEGFEETVAFPVKNYHTAIPSGEASQFVPGETLWVENTTTFIKTPDEAMDYGYEGGEITATVLKDGDIPEHGGYVLSGDVIDFEVFLYGDSPYNFTLTMGYDPEHDDADIYYFNERLTQWEPLDSMIDETNNTLTVSVPSFSIYGVFAKEQTDPPKDDEEKDEEKEKLDDEETGEKVREKDPGEDSDEEPAKDTKGDKLPDTATNAYNLLMIGLFFIIVGLTTLFFYQRKKRVTE
ncbi:GLUG motif-containing protein [Evansella tamaricis]|uniref:LPXTG cell wall anchor domain-containing protein n=1 Tax=Evansella tamaricis TaxID=2069301 RepID=A0ABS6JAX5_9BACI|nr:GLUG motif-containing protein [Evansella tamaricis]MBU9710580.1 LPXTG cell wall anchor domain-containing protein [Evansella tamaricis]